MLCYIYVYRGFYPKGGGEVILTPVTTGVVSSFEFMDKGDIVDVEIESYTAGVIPIRVNNKLLLINIRFYIN